MLLGVDIVEDVRRGLQRLTPREEQIIRMRWGIGEDGDYTRREIGERFDISAPRVAKIEEAALRKLRSNKFPAMRLDHWAAVPDPGLVKKYAHAAFKASITRALAYRRAQAAKAEWEALWHRPPPPPPPPPPAPPPYVIWGDNLWLALYLLALRMMDPYYVPK